ncbi:MAG: DUF362 domain-containing protein [Candidatus Lokiarchaeota archaeon]|nr:DUF362 domain-containing protein [Candidatus Lokiarchaeota archaeon]
MKKKIVVLEQSEYIFEEVKEKIQKIFEIIIEPEKIKDKTILIKPNCGPIAYPEEGDTIHPIVLKAVIQIVKEFKPKKILVAESSYVENDTMVAMKTSGLFEVLKKECVEFIDLKKAARIQIEINGLSLKKIELPELLNHVDLLISLAKLKTNVSATVTLSIKNLKGLIPDKYKKRFHLVNLANCIHDLYTNINVQTIGIIDGILGSELYVPKKGNILAGSNDLLSLDTHLSKLIGFSREEVKHLSLFEKPEFEVLSDEIIIPNFNKPNASIEDIEKEYKVKIIGRLFCSNCIGALIRGIKKAKDKGYLENEITFVIGKQEGKVTIPSEEFISVGNCMGGLNGKGIHIAGCPPVSNQIRDAILDLSNINSTIKKGKNLERN